MTELHQILGSLFADIAQSIFTSDLYSRDISRYYEQDALLRHFPVPRTEVLELEVNLKFAVSEVNLNPTQSIEREAGAAALFVDFCYGLSERFFEELHDLLLALTKKGRVIDPEIIRQSTSGVYPIYLRQDLLRFFQHNQASLIVDGEYQRNMARAGIIEIYTKYIDELIGDKLEQATKDSLLNDVTGAVGLDQRLKDLEQPLRYSWEQHGDFRLDVEVKADKLLDMSEILSSVSVKTHVRNYKWSEVEHQGKRTWWTLNPE